MKCFWMSALVWLAVMAYVLLAMPNETREIEQPEPNKLVAIDNGRIPGDDTVAVEPVIWEDNENELIEAALLYRSTVIKDCLITHYCAEKYPHICGNGDGMTATGVEARPGVVAVDPKVIPYGSTVMVDYGEGELVYYVASDCGRSIKGNHIDVCCWTHEEALNRGKTTATVYWCAEG